jgi:hypothetical protein
VVAALLDGDRFHGDQFAEWHEGRAGRIFFREGVAVARADPEGEQFIRGGFGGARQFEADGDVFAFFWLGEEVDGFAVDGDVECLGNGGGADAGEGGCFLIDDEAGLLLIRFVVPVRVDDSGGLLEDLADPGGEALAGWFVRAVDFGDERLEDRRSGGDFGDGDAGTVAGCDCGEARADDGAGAGRRGGGGGGGRAGGGGGGPVAVRFEPDRRARPRRRRS